MPRNYTRPAPPPIDPYKVQPLPINRPVAVYYRQSTEAQVGNVSTTLQTVDMIEHLERLGWVRERILMVDMDAGVSGTKKIKDRPGLSRIFDMIEQGQLGSVAAQDVDRFFRDVTQIETNIFIDACKRNNVMVLTPTMVYDFAHPTQGRFHMQMFRERAQQAADYIEYHVKGRLLRARNYRAERGFWTGRKIVPGYMLDIRERLADSRANPEFLHYAPFELYADVVLAYFELFRTNQGNMDLTQRQIEDHGPYFPELIEGMIPQGFFFDNYNSHRSPDTGKLVSSSSGLYGLFRNVTYIGHWTHKNAIVVWNNHPAIIPVDLFMYAFNRVSRTDFYGDPNPDYVPYRPYVRHNKAERQALPPVYTGLVFSDDLPDQPPVRLQAHWYPAIDAYEYIFKPRRDLRRKNWSVTAEVVDAIVNQLLVERLKETAIDEVAWETALTSMDHGEKSEVRRIESAIRNAQQTKDNLIASLAALTNSDMIQRAQASYEAADGEIASLRAELDRVKADKQRPHVLQQARPALQRVIQHWDALPSQERRSLFEGFASRITVHRETRFNKRVTVHWRDGSQSAAQTRDNYRRYFFWTPEELQMLRQMIESNASQVDILRAFPDYSWQALQTRYAYHFNNGHWPLTYTGERPYTITARWQDIQQAHSEPLQQVASSWSMSRKCGE